VAVTRRLEPWEEDRWLPLLAPRAADFPDADAFGAWRDQLVDLARVGALELQGVLPAEGGPATGALLVQKTGGHGTVLLGMGDLGGDRLEAAMGGLMARYEALTWTAETGPGWAERLAPLGVRAFDHQTFRNPLAETVPVLAAQPPDPAIAPWDDAYREAVVGVLAAANAGNLPGLLLTLPRLPTEQAVRDVLDARLGPAGDLMPEASFVYLVDGRPAGVILLIRGADGPALFDLAVLPEARGRKAGRAMVRAAQRALLAAGHDTMWFWTTDDNAPVHAIYEPNEAVLHAASRCAYWLRDPAGRAPAPRV
jgi:GNAT superfamily N-acetyltransferase